MREVTIDMQLSDATDIVDFFKSYGKLGQMNKARIGKGRAT